MKFLIPALTVIALSGAALAADGPKCPKGTYPTTTTKTTTNTIGGGGSATGGIVGGKVDGSHTSTTTKSQTRCEPPIDR